MARDTETIKKVVTILQEIDKDRVSVEDFREAFVLLMKFRDEIIKKTEQAIKEFETEANSLSDSVKDTSKTEIQAVKDNFDKEMSRHIVLINKELGRLQQNIERRLGQVRDGTKGEKGEPGEPADPHDVARVLSRSPEFRSQIKGQDGSPDTPEEVRDKLQSLKGGERLDVSAVKGLEKLREEVATEVRGRIPTPRYVPLPFSDDFSGDTDGSTKSFTCTKAPNSKYPRILVGSDWPFALRPDIDFTLAGKTLTLTSEVDAPSDGATLYFSYYQ